MFETALSRTGGERVLYETNVPTGSSLLKPGSEALYEFGDPTYFFPIAERRMATRRLDEVLDQAAIPSVDFIKLDVQGAEVEVLEGLGERLGRTTLGIELEVGLPGGYLEQPGIGAVDAVLRKAGFLLFDLRPVRLHRAVKGDRAYYPREVFGVHEQSATLAKRVWEADALYFRNPAGILDAADESALRKLAALYCAYGFFVEAHALFERALLEKRLSALVATSLQGAVVEWHRQAHSCFVESPMWWRLKRFVRRWESRVLRAVCGRRSTTWLSDES